MATTAIFAEILIVGLEAVVWLTFLLLTIAGVGELPEIVTAKENFTILWVVAAAYILGILLDRISDSVFFWLFKAPKDRNLPASFSTMRFQIMLGSEGMARFFEYQRSRFRVARATSLNAVLITITGTAFFLSQTDLAPYQVALFALGGVILLGLSTNAALRIRDAQDRAMAEAYNILLSNQTRSHN